VVGEGNRSPIAEAPPSRARSMARAGFEPEKRNPCRPAGIHPQPLFFFFPFHPNESPPRPIVHGLGRAKKSRLMVFRSAATRGPTPWALPKVPRRGFAGHRDTKRGGGGGQTPTFPRNVAEFFFSRGRRDGPGGQKGSAAQDSARTIAPMSDQYPQLFRGSSPMTVYGPTP